MKSTTERAADQRNQKTPTSFGILYNLHFIIKQFCNINLQSVIDVISFGKQFHLERKGTLWQLIFECFKTRMIYREVLVHLLYIMFKWGYVVTTFVLFRYVYQTGTFFNCKYMVLLNKVM